VVHGRSVFSARGQNTDLSELRTYAAVTEFGPHGAQVMLQAPIGLPFNTSSIVLGSLTIPGGRSCMA
jgi:hypothetical protein